jgi:hypothetical protein
LARFIDCLKRRVDWPVYTGFDINTISGRQVKDFNYVIVMGILNILTIKLLATFLDLSSQKKAKPLFYVLAAWLFAHVKSCTH